MRQNQFTWRSRPTLKGTVCEHPPPTPGCSWKRGAGLVRSGFGMLSTGRPAPYPAGEFTERDGIYREPRQREGGAPGMRATVMYGAGDVRLETLPDPQLSTGDDAIVRVVAACVCGSDLWPFRGVTSVTAPRQVGHEFVGVVEQIGRGVGVVKPGDFVIAPFYVCDGTCVHCRNGVSTSCVNGSWWGSPDRKGVSADGGQGEFVRVPLADGTLFPIGVTPDPAMIPGLATLSDVLCTGHHAAVSAGVRPGSVVAVVGDGAVGLCAVLAARRLGAAKDDCDVQASGPAGDGAGVRGHGHHCRPGRCRVAAVHRLTGGIGTDCVLERVGTQQSMQQALGSARPGGQIGFVGLPNGDRNYRSINCSTATLGCAAGSRRSEITWPTCSRTC